MTKRQPQSLIKALGRADDPWTEQAACARIDPARMRCFYPEPGPRLLSDIAEAKRICASCPVDHAICLAYGDRVSKGFGTFAGLTAGERERRRDALRRAA